MTTNNEPSELETLRRWKAEALLVLSSWDDAFDRSGVSCHLGGFKSNLMADEILRLRAQVERLAGEVETLQERVG